MASVKFVIPSLLVETSGLGKTGIYHLYQEFKYVVFSNDLRVSKAKLLFNLPVRTAKSIFGI
jgi:hypothetical protein